MMTSKIISGEMIESIRKLIEKSSKIAIVTHVSPDGDALGSSLGLFHFLEKTDNRATVVVPNDFPDFLKWMKGARDVLVYDKYPDFASRTLAEADLIFCLDFNIFHRVGKMEDALATSTAKKVLIDHHLDPAPVFDVTVSYPNVSSTSELIFRFICKMASYDLISKQEAECIYTGMMTDTGAFSYNSNDSDIYFIISQLLKKGIDKDLIYRRVYSNYTVDRVRLMGHIFKDNLCIYEKYATAVIHLSQAESQQYRHKPGDTEGLVNVPLSIRGIVFSAFFKEEKDKIKVSFRSVGDFPTNKVASEYFNGGGHLNASGGEYYGTLEEAMRHFESVLPEFASFLP